MVCIRCHNYMGLLISLLYHTTDTNKNRANQKEHKTGQIAGGQARMDTEATDVPRMKNRRMMMMVIVGGAGRRGGSRGNQMQIEINFRPKGGGSSCGGVYESENGSRRVRLNKRS